MKMKCKKISGIEKSVCTCEQKIAYNYAFSWSDTYKRRCKECTTQIQKAEILQDIIEFITADISRKETMEKYNADAIITAFRNGFVNYCNNFFIASDYEKIGKCFVIGYDII